MQCKLCNKEVDDKFYRHLNSSHKMKKNEYLELYPEQREEYYKQKPEVWNKGLTSKDHESIRKYAHAIKIYSNREDIRKKRSDLMISRYSEGDWLDPVIRAKVSKAGSDAWVSKIKLSTFTEKKDLLRNFTTAGNQAQIERRHLLTPEDYNRLYPFAKGIARYHSCDFCNKQMIAWFGGKPRPKKRFCDAVCYQDYCFLHSNYTLPKTVKMYYSSKMQTEFCLRSKLELWLAQLLDSNDNVSSWCTPPFCIEYEWSGKQRRYYPDFLVNDKWLIEVKSSYVRSIQGEERTLCKLKEAEKFCSQSGREFIYWQFDQQNLKEEVFKSDPRITEFIRNIS